MFSKFSSVLHQAVEAFSAVSSPDQEFTSHWKAITNYFLENKDHKVSIEHTLLGRHLHCMFEILQQDDHVDKTGPCLEYVLQHKILDTLATLARTDTPPGMKQEVLLFFTKLLSRLHHPLLPHVHVHKPVQRLVRLCGEQRAGPTEAEEIRFLCTLCAQLKAQPDLTRFFIESTPDSPLPVCNGVSKSAVTHQPGSTPKPPGPPAFPLVNSLISLMHSHDARVAVKSCEGLMLICSLQETSTGRAITQCTDLGPQLAAKTATLYRSVPRNLSALDIETAHAKWGFDVHMSREDDRYFPGKQQLLALLSWLDFCDQLVSMATQPVAKEVARHIRQDFLSASVKNDLLQTSESGAISSTCILTQCLSCVHSKPLVSEFVGFLLDIEDSQSLNPSPSVSLRKRLLDRCNHLSEQVSLCTLKLLDSLLLKSDVRVFDTLMLKYLSNGVYKLHVPNAQGHAKPDSHIDTPEKHTPASEGSPSAEDTTINSVPDSSSVTDREGGEGDGLSPQHDANAMETTASGVHKVVNSFLTLVPAELRSSTELGDTGYDTYLRDAHQQYSHTCAQCKDFHWPLLSSYKDQSPSNSFNTTMGSLHNTNMDMTCVDSNQSQDNSTSKAENNTSQADKSKADNSMSQADNNTNPADNGSEADKAQGSLVVSSVSNEAKTNLCEQTGSDITTGSERRTESEGVMDSVSLGVKPDSGKNETSDAPVNKISDAPWQEGDFLKMLLDRLSRMLDQSYALNLQLTSIVSRLCLLPHPAIHEYLLDPCVQTNVRTLYSVLSKVCVGLKERSSQIPNLSARLSQMRRQLSHYNQDVTSVEDGDFLSAIITLEEFCKELAAIAFVKHHQI